MALVSAMPVAAVMIHTSLAQRRDALQDASASTARVARLMALDQEHLLDGAAQVLTLLAYAPEVVERQADRCNAFVTVTRSHFPAYDNLGAATPDGDIFCSTVFAATRVNVGDRDYFVRAVRTRGRTLGVNHLGRIRKVPIVTLLQPAVVGAELRAVAFVTMDLVRLEEVLRRAELSAGTRAIVFGADGRVLAGVPTLPEAPSARVDPALTAAAAVNRDVVLDAPGLDGDAVVWGVSPVRGPIDTGLTVAVGMPRRMVVARANAVLGEQLITLAVAMTTMIVIAWVVGDAFVRRRIAALISAARTLGTGTLGARTGLPHDEAELGQLAQAFDDMAEALERQQGQLGAAEASRYEAETALEYEDEFLWLVLEGARDHAIFMLSPGGRVVSWHAGAKRVTGFAAPGVLGKPFASFLSPADGPETARTLLRRAVEQMTAEDERPVVCADGTHIVAELAITALWNGTTLRGFTVVMRDVTERRRTEVRLAVGNEERQVINSTIAALSGALTVGDAITILADNLRRDLHCTDGAIFVRAEASTSMAVAHAWQAGSVAVIGGKETAPMRARACRTPSAIVGPEGYVAMPLVVGDDVRGVAELRMDPSRLTRHEGGFFDTLGGRVGVALHAVEMHEQIARSSERLEHLSRKLLEVQETEKRGLARELHDEVGQMLTAIKINFQGIRSTADPATGAKRVRDGIEIVDGLLRRVRDLSLDLRPSILDDWGLAAALQWSAERTAERAGVVVDVATEIGDHRFPSVVETACFRVFQEAVTNALRHGHARHVVVELVHKPGALELFLHDDGTGFDVSVAQVAASRGKSLGLLGMAERVRLTGGVFTIDAEPGRGTWIRATFPLVPSPEGAAA